MRGGVLAFRVPHVKTPSLFALSALFVGSVLVGACASASSTEPGEKPLGDLDASPTSTADDGGTSAPTDAGKGGPAPAPACNATDSRASAITISVLPDQGEKAYTDVLGTAKKSVRVFGYQMGYGAVLDTLTAQAKAGLDVRVILDGNTQRTVNTKYQQALVAAGAKFQWSDPKFSYMHAKTIIVDEHEATVSTGNYGKSFLLSERNYVARVSDAQDVADLVALFDADFGQKSPDLSCTRLLVSPVNSRDRLIALIASAKTSLRIESMQFDDRDVHDAVLARKKAGVDVKIILADSGFVSANTGIAATLAQEGIAARYLLSPKVHVKSIVVDDTHAYLGSENISYTSLSKNREIGLVIDDAPALSAMTQTFDKDYLASEPFAAVADAGVDAGN